MGQEDEQMCWSRQWSEKLEFPLGLSMYRLNNERGETAELTRETARRLLRYLSGSWNSAVCHLHVKQTGEKPTVCDLCLKCVGIENLGTTGTCRGDVRVWLCLANCSDSDFSHLKKQTNKKSWIIPNKNSAKSSQRFLFQNVFYF